MRSRKGKHSPRPPAKEQARPGDVLGRADPPHGVRLGQRVARGVEHGRHHLAGEGPARERVDVDAPGPQRDRRRPGQVVQAGLGRAVRVVLERGDAEGVDAADVDHARGGARAGGGGGPREERDEELGEGEDALEVEGQEFRPGVVRVGCEVC